MKVRTLMLTLALCFVGSGIGFAQDPQIGTWKLNEAKSHIPAGLPRNTTVIYEALGDNVKVTMEGTRDGKPVHTEWMGKFDGKDYPVTGDPNADTRSYKKINDHTLTSSAKKGGTIVTTARAVVSADGNSRTVNISGNDSTGKKVTATAVYYKQ